MRRAALFSNCFYALLLIGLALIPRVPSIPGLSSSDFLAHALAYGFQGGLLFWLFEASSQERAAPWAFFGASGFGVLTEVFQLFSPVRHFEYHDMVADAVGAIVVVSLLFGVRNFWKWRAI